MVEERGIKEMRGRQTEKEKERMEENMGSYYSFHVSKWSGKITVGIYNFFPSTTNSSPLRQYFS